MYPTMPSENSLSITCPWYRYGRNMKVGDIVWARSPYFQRQNVGKRIIGMPGDYVVLDEANSPKIGGAAIAGKPGAMDESNRPEPMMVQVPEGHVWLAGDNLPYSRDSRTYGPMPMALIRGKIIATSHGWLMFSTWKWYGNNDQLDSQDDIETREMMGQARDAWHKDRKLSDDPKEILNA